MAKLFDKVQFNKPKLNKFDLSHERKFSMNMGDLVPFQVQEMVPGDRFRVSTEVLMRMAPMLAPIMHRVNIKTDYFFVPNRIVWNEWEPFITGGKDGLSAPIHPYFNVHTAAQDAAEMFRRGALSDYMGLPEQVGGPSPGGAFEKISALPFRAYQMIYNEYFRDPTLTNVVPFGVGSGDMTGVDDVELLRLRKSSWEKDYFTSALPFAQRGADVSLPIEGTSNDVEYFPQSKIFDTGGAAVGNNKNLGSGNLDVDLWAGDPTPASGEQARIENVSGFSFSAADVTINVLRRAVKVQEWLEKMARGGYRYVEQMLVMFGVVGDDARLQRPEYLGGGRNPMVISEVLSTFQDDAGAIPQGSMAGHGISVGRSNGFTYRAKEHGYVIGIIRVLPRTAYFQGIPRHFQRFDKFDHYWPTFAHLGEQEVLLKELFSYYDKALGDAVFGYQSRYCDYKYMQDSVHGDFKTELAYWHMARIFEAGTPPALNAAFVEADPTHRIFAVEDPTLHKLYVQLYNKVDALRPMPYFGTPSL